MCDLRLNSCEMAPEILEIRRTRRCQAFKSVNHLRYTWHFLCSLQRSRKHTEMESAIWLMWNVYVTNMTKTVTNNVQAIVMIVYFNLNLLSSILDRFVFNFIEETNNGYNYYAIILLKDKIKSLQLWIFELLMKMNGVPWLRSSFNTGTKHNWRFHKNDTQRRCTYVSTQ